MRWTRTALIGWLVARFSRLRFPALTGLAAGLFLLDLVVPDLIPFADELLLGLATALLASWRTRRIAEPSSPEVSDRGRV